MRSVLANVKATPSEAPGTNAARPAGGLLWKAWRAPVSSLNLLITSTVGRATTWAPSRTW